MSPRSFAAWSRPLLLVRLRCLAMDFEGCAELIDLRRLNAEGTAELVNRQQLRRVLSALQQIDGGRRNAGFTGQLPHAQQSLKSRLPQARHDDSLIASRVRCGSSSI